MAARGVALPAHQIRSADVPQFLEHSAVSTTYFHNTDLKSYRQLMRQGVRRSRLTQFGRAFYTAAQPTPRYGPYAVEVAVDSRRPFYYSHDAMVALVGEHHAQRMRFMPDSKQVVNDALRAHGYDAVIQRGDGIDWVAALDHSRVRLVVDGGSADAVQHALRGRALLGGGLAAIGALGAVAGWKALSAS